MINDNPDKYSFDCTHNSLSLGQTPICSVLPPTSDGMATRLETPLMVLAAGMVGDHWLHLTIYGYHLPPLLSCLLTRYGCLPLQNTIFPQIKTHHAVLFSAWQPWS